MQIFVRDYGKTFTLDVEPSDTICVLRRLIFYKTQMPPVFQNLHHARKLLGLASGNAFADDDTRTLESYGIAKEATLTLSCRGTNKREFVPDEESYSSKQKRRALSNAVAPHKRRVERLTSERDEALAARERLTSERNEARAALGETRTARDEALAARDEWQRQPIARVVARLDRRAADGAEAGEHELEALRAHRGRAVEQEARPQVRGCVAVAVAEDVAVLPVQVPHGGA